MKIKGTVNILYEDKNYGFIKGEDGKDYFFRIKDDGIKVGDKVMMGNIQKPKKSGQKPEAREVVIENPTPLTSNPAGGGNTPYKFFNPYNFIRYYRKSEIVNNDNTLLGKCPPPPHDRHTGLSGTITVKCKAHTPIFVSDSDIVNGADPKTYEFFNVNGQHMIPSTSIKGAIRSTFEAVTNSCFSVFDDVLVHYHEYSQRNLNDYKGCIVTDINNGSYTLKPLKEERLRVYNHKATGDKVTFSIVPIDGTTNSLFGPNGVIKDGDVVLFEVESYCSNSNIGLTLKRVKKIHVCGKRKEYYELKNVSRTYSYEKKTYKFADFDKNNSYIGIVKITGKTIDDPINSNKFAKKYEHVLYLDKNINSLRLGNANIANMDINTFISNLASIKTSHTVNADAINNYLSINKERHEYAKRHEPKVVPFLTHLKKDDLRVGSTVYYNCKNKKLVWNKWGRTWYSHTTGDMLDKYLHPCTKYNALCPACRVFGWVKQGASSDVKERVAYKGRVSFSDAIIGSSDIENHTSNIPLVIQGTPHETNYYFRLIPKKGGTNAKKTPDNADYNNSNNMLHGRTAYRTHEEAKEGNYKYPFEVNDDTANQRRQITNWLKKGSEFSFTVRFNHLAPLELGALLWTLKLEDACYHKLGYGKPIGFGAFKVETVDCKILNIHERYGIEGTKHQKIVINNCIDEFKNAIKKRFGENDFNNLKNIKSLIAIAKIKIGNIHHPRPTKKPDKDRPSFEWFVGNKKRQEPLALQFAEEDTGLPIINKDGNEV